MEVDQFVIQLQQLIGDCEEELREWEILQAESMTFKYKVRKAALLEALTVYKDLRRAGTYSPFS